MTKHLNQYYFILILKLIIFINCSAGDITVANPGNSKDIQPAVTAALAQAVDGDIIILPEGSFIVNKSIVVTKFISFRGAGKDKTILYRDETVPDNTLSNSSEWDAIIRFNIDRDVSSRIVVSSITFRSKAPSLKSGDGKSLAMDVGVKFINCLDFVVTQCKFQYFGNGAIEIFHRDSIAGGLIYNNDFIHNHKGEDGSGLGYGVVIYGENKQWIKNPQLGSSNFIFIEDNLFTEHRHAIAAGGCALYVARYNKFTNNTLQHVIDTHNASGGETPGTENYFGTRAVEIYNNEIINTLNVDGTPIKAGQSATLLNETAVKMRAGDAIVYKNKVEGFRFAVAVSNYGVDDSITSQYPFRSQIGYLSGMVLGDKHVGIDTKSGDGDLFSYDNIFTPWPGNISSSIFYNYVPKMFVEDRDYHFVAKPGYTSYTYPHPLGKVVTTSTNYSDNYSVGELSIYPNPAKYLAVISFQVKVSEKTVLAICDASGKTVFQHNFISMDTGEQSIEIDASCFDRGIYFINLSIGGTVLNEKFLVIQ